MLLLTFIRLDKSELDSSRRRLFNLRDWVKWAGWEKSAVGAGDSKSSVLAGEIIVNMDIGIKKEACYQK